MTSPDAPPRCILTNVTWWLPSPLTITQPGGTQRAVTVGLSYLNEHLMSELSSICQAVRLKAPRAHRPTHPRVDLYPLCGGAHARLSWCS